jgi:hypothetical protein
MKNLLSLAVCLFFGISSYAQNHQINLEYDDAGNRIKRYVITLDGERMANPDQAIVFEDESVTIYPNPTRYYFNLEFSKINDNEQMDYILSDEQGKLIEQGKIEQQKTKFDLSDHRNGIYFLNILRKGKKSTWQIVKIG